jgi:hypothetical protein
MVGQGVLGCETEFEAQSVHVRDPELVRSTFCGDMLLDLKDRDK